MALERPILLYDGLCNFCDASVQWVLKYNASKDIYFAPLQSDFAENLLHDQKQDMDLRSIIFIANGRVYKKSKALGKIMTHLSSPWPIIGHLLFAIPSIFADPFYTLVANNRYKIAGKRTNCRVPSTAERARFIME